MAANVLDRLILDRHAEVRRVGVEDAACGQIVSSSSRPLSAARVRRCSMAQDGDLEATQPPTPAGVSVGGWAHRGRTLPLRYDGAQHVFGFAPDHPGKASNRQSIGGDFERSAARKRATASTEDDWLCSGSPGRSIGRAGGIRTRDLLKPMQIKSPMSTRNHDVFSRVNRRGSTQQARRSVGRSKGAKAQIPASVRVCPSVVTSFRAQDQAWCLSLRCLEG